MFRRIVGLWLALIVVFTGFYLFFSRRGQDGGVPPAVYLVVGVAAGGFAVARVVIRSRTAVRHNNQGVALIGQGRHAAALEAFEKGLSHLGHSALLLMNVGVANQLLWRLDASEEALFAASRKLDGRQLHLLIFPHLALTYALRGKVAEAREAIQRCQALQNDASPPALLAQAVVLCREEKWSEGAGVLARHELRSLAGAQRGLAEALQAWCATHGSGAGRQVDLAGVYGETGPEAIKPHWPELVAFLDGLAGAQVRDRLA